MANKTKYVDGFVLVVPKNKTAVYRKMAQGAATMWMKYGALSYKECIGDDVEPDMDMPVLSFLKMAKAKPNEAVWFSYIEYKSKKHRDQVNKKVMAEMNKQADKYKDMPMPFDTKRMAYGGFKVIVNS